MSEDNESPSPQSSNALFSHVYQFIARLVSYIKRTRVSYLWLLGSGLVILLVGLLQIVSTKQSFLQATDYSGAQKVSMNDSPKTAKTVPQSTKQAPTPPPKTSTPPNNNSSTSQKTSSQTGTPGSSPPPHQATSDSQHWLIGSEALYHLGLVDQGVASWFFNGTQDWVINGPVQPSIGQASQVKSYESYAQFASDVTGGNIAAGTKWVEYDDENWPGTPTNEQQHPATYLKQFADLAHQHGYKVIETPARDLMSVQGADCNRTTTGISNTDSAYLGCNIAADTRYADAMDIQAQADQPNLSAYTSLVDSATGQLRSVNASIIIIAGLTSYRGYTADSITAAWQAVHSVVQGFWMNVETSSQPSITAAQQALGTIKATEE